MVRLVLAQDPALDAAGNQREQGLMVEGWRRQGNGLQVWYGAGNHFTLLKAPNVLGLARWWLEGWWLGRWCREGNAGYISVVFVMAT